MATLSPAIVLAFAVGCGFTHGSAPATADAAAIDSATRDAPAGGAKDAAPVWTVIDTITITTYASGSTPVQSTSAVTLANGVTYRLRASGTFTCTTTGLSADAEYWDVTSPNDLASTIDFGVSIDDVTVDGTKSPASWGAYTATHVYETMYVGKGTALVAVLYDSQYNNNNGTLKLELLELR